MKKNNLPNIFSGLRIRKNSLSQKEKDEMLAVFMQNITDKQTSGARQSAQSPTPLVRYTVAATLIGIVFIFAWKHIPAKTLHASRLETITLADSTHITLNQGAVLSYRPLMFFFDRKVTLSGQAFFDVSKKGLFTVQTQQGYVQILGTKFTVSTDPIFNTQCYSGLVSVQDKDTQNKVLLHPGQQVTLIDNHFNKAQVIENNPYWLTGTFSFTDKPLSEVISVFAEHYKLQVEGLELTQGLDFTGSFPVNNRQIACDIILGPYNLSYTLEKQRLIILHH